MPLIASTAPRVASKLFGYLFAFANCALFVLYVVLGHRIARSGGSQGIDRLGAAIGVGISSSVIPYVCDQLAMARPKRASFALVLALLPATASAVGIVVLRQIPSPAEIAGIILVIAGVALHRGQD